MSENERFDLAVIGTGGAAFSAAIRAHELGAERIALIERQTLGGTCVNVGCVPSKALLAAAAQHHRGLHHPFAGIPHAESEVGLAALRSQKDHLVAEMRQGKYLDLAHLYGFELIEGNARFSSPDSLDVDGRAIKAARFIVATGAEPAVPDIEGIETVEFLTSTTAMELDEVPEHLIVVGAGFVGLEQAQLFRRLGAKVTLVGRFAPQAEPELSEALASIFEQEGIRLIPERVARVEGDSGVRVSTSSGATVRGSHLLVAVGRSPRTRDLALHDAGVELNARGAIVTDEHQRTSSPDIYAAGDVTADHQFVYLAAAQGAVAAENAIADQGTSVDLVGLPEVVFTDPQLASAGLTEAESQSRGIQTDSRVLPLDKVPRAVVEHDTRGAIKVVADTATRQVLGVHALSPGAGDLILAATYAIKNQMTVEELAHTWAPYLTHAEGVRLAARSFDHDIERLSCCA